VHGQQNIKFPHVTLTKLPHHTDFKRIRMFRQSQQEYRRLTSLETVFRTLKKLGKRQGTRADSV